VLPEAKAEGPQRKRSEEHIIIIIIIIIIITLLALTRDSPFGIVLGHGLD
jgi:flagellar basal body-associated protein FliL